MSNKLVLSVVLDADEKGLVSGLKLGSAKLNEFKGEVQDTDQPLDQLDKQTISTTKAIHLLGGAVAALGLGNLTADMYESIDSMQGYQAQLKTITGDMKSASAELDRLIGFARTTPFTLDQSVEAFAKLTHLGLNPSERAMLSYGNTASAMGKDMMQMVEAVADASVFEFERLKEFGIKASQEKNKVSFTFQGVTTEIAKNSSAIQEYLLKIGETKFAGAMSDQMDRLSAKSSNLGMNIDLAYKALGDMGATELAGKAIDNLADGVAHLTDNLPEVVDKVETLAGFFAVGAALHYAPILFTAMSAKTVLYTKAVTAATASTTLLANKQAALIALWAGWEIGSYINDEFVEARVAGLAFIGYMDKGITHLTYAFKKGAKAVDIAWNNAISFIYEQFGDLLELIADGAELLGMDEYAAQFRTWSNEVSNATDESESYEQAIAALNIEYDEALRTIDDNITALVVHERQQESNSLTTKTATDVVNSNTDATVKNTQAIEFNESAFQSLQDKLDPVGKLTRELKAEQALLTQALSLGKISANEFSEASKKLNKQFDEQVAKTTGAKESVSEYATSWEQAIERVDEAIADGWLDLLEGKSTNVFESVLGGFKRMLAEMLHMAITKPIMLNIQANAGGLFSGGSSGGGVLDILSNGVSGGIGGGIMQIGNMVSGAGSMLGIGSLGAFGSGFASTGAILGTQGMIGGMGTAFSNIGGLFGSGSIAGGIGAALPIVGMVAGAAKLIDSLSGGGLFGTSYKTTDHGVNLNYSGGGFDGENYEKKKKKRSLFRGSKRKTVTSDLDANVVDGMNAYFDGVENLIVNAAEALDITEVSRTITHYTGNWKNLFEMSADELEGTTTTYTQSLEDYLNSFSASATLSLKGLSEQDAENAIQDWTTSTADRMISGVFGSVLNGMAIEGENLTQTLTRVISQLAIAESAFDSINLSLTGLAASAGVSAVQYADDVAQEAGGTDRLSALVQTYQAAFFSEEELLVSQLTNAAAQMESALGLIGATQDNFRSQFESASSDGLAAAEVVDWLEAGNLVAQVNAISEQLTSVAGESAAQLIADALADGKTLADSLAGDVALDDPVIEATVSSTEAQTEQLTNTMHEQTQVFQDLNETSKSQHSEQIGVLSQIASSMESLIQVTQQQISKSGSEVRAMVSELQNLRDDIRHKSVLPMPTPVKPIVGSPL